MRSLVSVAVAVAALGMGGPAPAIAHGDTVPPGRYSFATRLVMSGLPTGDGGTRDSWCSGALIAPRWVITAGHCFRDADGKRVAHPVARRTTAIVQIHADGTQQAMVVAVHQSPSNDVALAELDHDVTGIAPLSIARSAPATGERLRLTGYGVTAEDGRAPARLQTGGFVVTSTSGTVIDVAGVSPRPDTSACLHDSGAPYFRESAQGAPELVAVVSDGPPCPHTGPDQAARVDVIADWINRTVHGPPRWRTGAAVLVALGAAAGLLLGVLRWSSRPKAWAGRAGSRAK